MERCGTVFITRACFDYVRAPLHRRASGDINTGYRRGATREQPCTSSRGWCRTRVGANTGFVDMDYILGWRMQRLRRGVQCQRRARVCTCH